MVAAFAGRTPTQIMSETQRELATGIPGMEQIDRGADTRDRGNEVAEHIMFDRNAEARQTLLQRLIAALSALKQAPTGRQR